MTSDRTPRRLDDDRRAGRLWRAVVVLFVALSLSGMARAAEEAVESAVHVAETGHGAHATTHPEGGSHADPEHFCFGAVHQCACCPSGVAVVQPNSVAASSGDRPEAVALTWRGGQAVDGIRKRIDRPPRA